MSDPRRPLEYGGPVLPRASEALSAETGEFDDIPTAFLPPEVQLERLRNPAVVRLVLGMAIAIAIVAWPQRTNGVFIVLLALFMGLFSLQMLYNAMRVRPRDWPTVATSAVGVTVAVLLLLDPERALESVGRSVALLMVLFAASDFVRTLRRRRREGGGPLVWPVAKVTAFIAVATVLAVYPSQLLVISTVAFAAMWGILGALALAQVLTAPEDEEIPFERHLVWEWLSSRTRTPVDRRLLYRKILFEGPDLSRRLVSFIALMSFATIIAAMGIINDSTAVVIGAMLVAPLMTPLMGMAISVVMGWPNRLLRNTGVAVLGIVLTIGISYLLTRVAPVTFDPTTNGQIVSRSNPTVIDLITATAAGAAGAYGLSRRDVSDALPGVAIAISLVPPLSVVGIAWAEEDWAAGNGALLLFTTNFLAIVVMGGLVFVMTGITPIAQVARNRQRVRTASASLVALTGIVLGGLLLNGSQITANAFEIGTIRKVTASWLEDSPNHDLIETRVDGNSVTVVLIGPPTNLPDPDTLDAELEEALGDSLTTEVRVVIQRRLNSEYDAEAPDSDQVDN